MEILLHLLHHHSEQKEEQTDRITSHLTLPATGRSAASSAYRDVITSF
jgi:hypothetical protein